MSDTFNYKPPLPYHYWRMLWYRLTGQRAKLEAEWRREMLLSKLMYRREWKKNAQVGGFKKWREKN